MGSLDPLTPSSLLVLLCILALLASPTSAAQEDSPSLIHLRSGAIDTKNIPEIHHLRRREDQVFRPYLVHHQPAGREAVLEAISSLYEQSRKKDGLTPASPTMGYIPHHTTLIPLTNEMALSLSSFPGIDAVIELLPEMKLSPSLPPPPKKTKKEGKGKKRKEDLKPHSMAILIAHLTEKFTPETLDLPSWKALLQSIPTSPPLSLHPRFSEILGTQLLISCPTTSVSKVAEWLSSLPQVLWVELGNFELEQNNFFAKKITFPSPGEPGIPSSGYDLTYGRLDGSGQIIGILDSGLDFKSCFFHDPQHPEIPGNNGSAPSGFGSTHRKIIGYQGRPGLLCFDPEQGATQCLEDYLDDKDGHGTHVTGTILGSAIGTSLEAKKFNGIAPNAKLYFQDLGVAGSLQNVINVQEPLEEAYKHNVRIHSNSWGTSLNRQRLGNFGADEFAWDHPDFLLVFAAGNNGEKGLATIGSPGNSKNVLTVGASVNSKESDSAVINLMAIDISNQFEDFQSLFCCSLSPSTCSEESIARFKDSECERLHLSESLCETYFYNISLPLLCQSQDANDYCLNPEAAISSCHTLYGVLEVMDRRDEHDLAAFSSVGPTWDLRIKPDVVAPGDYIISARATEENQGVCDLDEEVTERLAVLEMQGTSMATPVVAGLAALVRQYLTEGFHPSGAHPSPSGSLLKGLLIHSAQPLGGDNFFMNPLLQEPPFQDRDLSIVPSIFQGYGLVNLRNILQFSPQDPVKLKFFDDQAENEVIRNSDEYAMYCLKKAKGVADTPLKVTLTYTDYPAQPYAFISLVNDLDLILISPSGFSLALNDRRNNVEQVHLSTLIIDEGVYRIKVVGVTVVVPQPYSLVVTGDVEFVHCADYPTVEVQLRSKTQGLIASTVIFVLLFVATVGAVAGYFLWKKKNAPPKDFFPMES